MPKEKYLLWAPRLQDEDETPEISPDDPDDAELTQEEEDDDSDEDWQDEG